MGRISRQESNLYTLPKGAFIRNAVYVYVNTSNKYVPASQQRKDEGKKGYTDHDSVCIGIIADKQHPKTSKFYANQKYAELFLDSSLPEPPQYSDSLAVGLYAWIKAAAEDSGLIEDLCAAFAEDDVKLILDLCAYMLSRESAVMQHFPAWAREHVLFSDDILSDISLRRFFKNNLSISRINQFREKWALRNICNGRLYLGYDSTHVNSQPYGVIILKNGQTADYKGHCQVNTHYVIRMSDGLPLTYLHAPGAVTCTMKAQEIIAFAKEMTEKSQQDVHLCCIFDRGCITENDLRQLDDAGIDYILMLHSSFSLYDELSDAVIDCIRSYKNELRSDSESELYGITKTCRLYAGGRECSAQIFWNFERYNANRKAVASKIDAERLKLETFIREHANQSVVEEKLKWIPEYFKLTKKPVTPKIIEKAVLGRGPNAEKAETPAFYVTGYEDDETAINHLYQKTGIAIFVTSKNLTAQETAEACAKRDCIEQFSRSLKSHSGMNNMGLTPDEAVHGKGLLWFVAAVLQALLFNGTVPLQVSDKNRFSVPAMIDELEAIKADKNPGARKRQRRYKLTPGQQMILSQWQINEQAIDSIIADLTV